MGFDPSGALLLTVSHSGRGVFSASTWQRVARDTSVLYPANGFIRGIGPLAGKDIAVISRDELNDQITLQSPNGLFHLIGESDGITVQALGA